MRAMRHYSAEYSRVGKEPRKFSARWGIEELAVQAATCLLEMNLNGLGL